MKYRVLMQTNRAGTTFFYSQIKKNFFSSWKYISRDLSVYKSNLCTCIYSTSEIAIEIIENYKLKLKNKQEYLKSQEIIKEKYIIDI